MHTLWLGVNKKALTRVRLDPSIIMVQNLTENAKSVPEVSLKCDANLQFSKTAVKFREIIMLIESNTVCFKYYLIILFNLKV